MTLSKNFERYADLQARRYPPLNDAEWEEFCKLEETTWDADGYVIPD